MSKDVMSLAEWTKELRKDPAYRAAEKRLKAQQAAFRKRMIFLIHAKGETSCELAHKLKLTTVLCDALFSGTFKPQPATLDRLAEHFELDVGLLWPEGDVLWPTE